MSKKYTYVVKNLDCAQCAKNMEDKIKKVQGFNNVNYNFATMKLNFETDRTEFFPELKKVIKACEPEAILEDPHMPATPLNKKVWDINLILFITGLIIGLTGLLIPMNDLASTILVDVGAAVMVFRTFQKAMIQLFKDRTINENLLITISVIGALIIGENMEGLMVIALYSIGKMLESRALNRSRTNIRSLMEIQPEFAVVKADGKEERMSPDAVKIGSTIIVRPGERVPLDGKVSHGTASINISHLTGESVPAAVTAGDKILSGSILIDGYLEIITESVYKDSAVSRIMNLIENATDKKSKTETFISKFAKWYTLGVMALAVIVFLGSFFIFHDTLQDSIYRGLIFLVISCPCAFAISVPLSYFSAIGRGSKRGILIKGSNYLDVAASLKQVIFDKTGTLTTGNFGVKKIKSLNKKYKKEDILKLAALGEQYSVHPIAKAIMHIAHDIKLEEIADFTETAGRGISYTWKGDKIFIGKADNQQNSAVTLIYVHVNGEVVGEIDLSDTIKPGSKKVCDYLSKHGIDVSILSGDNKFVTQYVANELGVRDYHCNMLPEEKYKWLENTLDTNTNKHTHIAFVGDGINDAPSLSRADLGVSMGLAGSPATIEASDIVIVDDEPQKITDLIRLSKYNKRVVTENIIFAAVAKIVFLVLGTLDIVGMLAAVFADVGVTLIAILSSLRVLRFKFDNIPQEDDTQYKKITQNFENSHPTSQTLNITSAHNTCESGHCVCEDKTNDAETCSQCDTEKYTSNSTPACDQDKTHRNHTKAHACSQCETTQHLETNKKPSESNHTHCSACDAQNSPQEKMATQHDKTVVAPRAPKSKVTASKNARGSKSDKCECESCKQQPTGKPSKTSAAKRSKKIKLDPALSRDKNTDS